MARLEDKIAEIKDPALRQAIEEEVKTLKEHKTFGLVFEHHQPEVVPLFNAKVKTGETVAKRGGKLSETYRVERVRGGMAELVKHADDSRETCPVDGLTVVRRMGEPIYPALTPIESITNTDPRQPHHVLIEADNYHALQLLNYLYAGKVDCIYIDPPYNTGARDWKYNNDYVDKNDSWRHSKWLTFMENRLTLARRLLKPNSGVLVATIDRNELHHLGMLLVEIFSDAIPQIVTICINPSGASGEGFSRVEEYAFFCFLGSARPTLVNDDGLSGADSSDKKSISLGWESLLRRGNAWFRKARPNLCYPVLLSKDEKQIIGVGEPLKFHDNDALDLLEEQNRPAVQNGHPLAWPVRSDGRLGIWRVDGRKLELLRKGGFAYVTKRDEKRGTWTLKYLMEGSIHAIKTGTIEIVGTGEFGEKLLRRLEHKQGVAKTMWNRGRHIAGGSGGTNLLVSVLGKRDLFSFPKSIYAVSDCIQAAIGDRPNALVVDFFAGSGTTLNAVNLLNATDGGQRQCILVTNNEVSEAEAQALKARGFKPGDEGYEALGICRWVTWPRSKFTIQGHRDDGTALPGEYLTGRTVTKEKRRTIQQLGFAEGRSLSKEQRRQLASLIPNLPQGKLEADAAWFLDEECPVSILWDVRQVENWLEALAEAEHLTAVYVVTTETKLFKALKEQIQDTLGPLLVEEEEKRPLSAGFPANLDYFKLDFLQPQEVQMGRQFAAILPILWMMAGAKGKHPEPPAPSAPWLIPPDCPFAVLLQETRFKEFHRAIAERTDLSHVFIVTNSRETYHQLREELGDYTVAQLYKDYLENFKINLMQDKP